MDINNCCRACLKLFSQNDCEKDLRYKRSKIDAQFIACCGYGELNGVTPPRHLCTVCTDKIIEFYNFKQMCFDSLKKWIALKPKVSIIPNGESSSSKDDVCDITIIDSVLASPFEVENDWESVQKIEICRVTENEPHDIEHSFQDSQKAQNESDHGDTPSDILNDEISIVKSLQTKQKFKCTLCPIEFDCEKAIIDHMRSHQNLVKKSEKFQCTICQKIFYADISFKGHMRKHQGLPPYPCDREGCSRTFTYAVSLTRHFAWHDRNANDRLTCFENGCNQKFLSMKDLRLHQRKNHTRIHICEICGNVLKTEKTLRAHRFRHKDRSEWPLVCDYPNCGRRFFLADKLKEHQMRHYGIKNFKCPHCDIRMTLAADMRNHINLHTRELEYNCQMCSKIFYSYAQRDMHIRRVHKKGLLYPCKYCRYRFRTEEKLKIHEKGHEGEKMYDCTECERSFSQPRFRTLHLQKTHGRKIVEQEATNDEMKKLIYDCPECPRSFAQSRFRSLHLQKTHGHSNLKQQITDEIKMVDGMESDEQTDHSSYYEEEYIFSSDEIDN